MNELGCQNVKRTKPEFRFQAHKLCSSRQKQSRSLYASASSSKLRLAIIFNRINSGVDAATESYIVTNSLFGLWVDFEETPTFTERARAFMSARSELRTTSEDLSRALANVPDDQRTWVNYPLPVTQPMHNLSCLPCAGRHRPAVHKKAAVSMLILHWTYQEGCRDLIRALTCASRTHAWAFLVEDTTLTSCIAVYTLQVHNACQTV